MLGRDRTETQPWVTCFLARILVDYVESSDTRSVGIDYPALFQGLEWFEQPSDPESFVKDINNWIPLVVLRNLAVWCEQTFGRKDFAYLAAKSYFSPASRHLASLFEIFLRVLDDARLSFISSQMWGALQTNYLQLQSFQKETERDVMYMLARFPEHAPAAVSSIYFLRGTMEGLLGLYPFVDAVESVEEISQVRIGDIVDEFPDFEVVTHADKLQIRHRLRRDAVITAEATGLRTEVVPLPEEFLVNMPDMPICPSVDGQINVLTASETDTKQEQRAPVAYKVLSGGELTQGTLRYLFKEGSVYDAPYCRCKFAIRQRKQDRETRHNPNIGRNVPQLILDHLRHMKTAQERMIEGVIEQRKLASENVRLREELDREHSFAGIIGKSPSMRSVYRSVRAIAGTDLSVLIQGETGTGKELIAKAIHDNSPRKSAQFVDINCGAITETLLESELFGHEKGAFTGATAQRKGVFEHANNGTLFLDEIGETSASTQVKLLRVLQEGRFQRVGSSESNEVNVRIIAATNQDLEDQVKKGLFRDDLYYRLNVFPITVPPLRERLGDIPLLIAHFIDKHGRRINNRVRQVDPNAMALLGAYHWPGNVRELENVVQRMLVVAVGQSLSVGDLPPEIRGEANALNKSGKTELREITRQSSEIVEKQAISEALSELNGNVTVTAKALGISRATLQKKMKLFGLDRRDFLGGVKS